MKWQVSVAFVGLAVALLPGCRSSHRAAIIGPSKEEVLAAVADMKPPEIPDPYAPQLHAVEQAPFPGASTMKAYRFSDAQLARMALSKLEARRFIAYVEKRWPVERLREYCVPTNRWPRGYQNLVSLNCPLEAEIHKGKPHGFDRIAVYVSEDDGRGKYFDSAGWNWHRWTYSLNVFRKRDHWGMIEDLPNDFMDSPNFDLIERGGETNGGQSIRSETNQTPSAAGSRR